MTEFIKEAKFNVIDPIEYYKEIFNREHNTGLLHFIDLNIASELANNSKYATIMLNYPYYNIRAIYASVTKDIAHQKILSNDKDWRVRAGLATNKNLATEIFETLKSDTDKQITSIINARSNKPC